MRVIGICGPVGSGKSTLARLLACEPGAVHLDLDAMAWETYAPGGPAYGALVARFGTGILRPDGTVDRRKLAQAALASPQAKADLEALVHPAVMDEVRKTIEHHRGRGTSVLLVEGALLLSSPHVDRSLFDAFLWLDVPREERRRRLVTSGLDREVVEQRLHAQQDLAPARDPRVYLIDGRGSPEEVARRAKVLLNRLG